MTETILVVEDEALVAKDLQRSLSGLGYRVPATAGSAVDALRCAERHHPDLVLMDVRIRGADDGITAAGALRARYGVPIVYLTAYGDRATVARAKDTSPYGYLLKPVKIEELRITVELALHKHAIDRELRERERWFATTLRSIADAVIAVDAAGRVVSLNRMAEALTGWSALQAIGQPLDDVLQLVDAVTLEARPGALSASRTHGGPHRDGALRARDGRVHLISDSVAPITDDAGQASGAVVVFRDVGPERRLQQQLELSRRMAALGTLAAGVAHEINNPLAYIRTNIQFVRELLAPQRGSDDWIAEADEALADADVGTEEVRRIVADLRVFSAPTEQAQSAGDVGEAVKWAVDVVGDQVRERARLVVDVAPTPPVQADGGRLGQVLVNLLTNASQAIDPGRVDDNAVTVRAWTERDGWAVLEVADTGAGIAPDQLPRIFDPFFSTRRGGRGTGLGLAICHGIVSSYGGSIDVTSRVGAGSQFRVRLPPAQPAGDALASADGAPPAARAGAPASAPGPGQTAAAPLARLLLVDDDPLVRNALTRTLAGHFEIVCAEHGRAGLALLEVGERFPLILCDLTMPGMSGIELYELLRARYPDQARRMLFITGGAVSSEAATFLTGAPLGHVEKPFDRSALVARLSNLIGDLGPPAP
jgi:PAS domain S-box-containing protein